MNRAQSIETLVNRPTQLYLKDGRRPVEMLSGLLETDLLAANWIKIHVCYQDYHLGTVDRPYSIDFFLSPPAAAATLAEPVDSLHLWIGAHGEEPAGSEAAANERTSLIELGKKIPIVLGAILNPAARDINWRFEDAPDDPYDGHGVTPCDHLVLERDSQGNLLQPYRPRADHPAGVTNYYVLTKIMELNQICRPKVAIELHEDRIPEEFPENDPHYIKGGYIYMCGEGPTLKAIGQKLLELMAATGMPIVESGTTNNEEAIREGVAANSYDGSLSLYYGERLYWHPGQNQVIGKDPALAYVVETAFPCYDTTSLSNRVEAQANVIRHLDQIWAMANAVMV